MIRAQWTLALTTGPVVGTAQCPDVAAATRAVESAVRAALGDRWGPHHAAAVRQLARAADAEAPSALADTGEWRWASTAVVVTLTSA
ncbi:hypothetical protein [Streptomyces albus]|uniref:hypothetical protein n=1 Tax=Streptomyces albus TaxID=1888 RepID=UPI003F1B5C9E